MTFFILDNENNSVSFDPMANWFVAFKINTDGWYTQLLPHLPAETRVFHPADIHMTVAFLGQLDISRIEPVTRIINEFQFSPVNLIASKLVVLPSQRHFTAVCLDFKGSNDSFNLLMDSWKDALFKAAELPVDSRKFLAHATVCRPPRTINRDTRNRILDSLMNAPALEIPILINTIALYTWADDRNSQNYKRQFKTVFERSFP